MKESGQFSPVMAVELLYIFGEGRGNAGEDQWLYAFRAVFRPPLAAIFSPIVT